LTPYQKSHIVTTNDNGEVFYIGSKLPTCGDCRLITIRLRGSLGGSRWELGRYHKEKKVLFMSVADAVRDALLPRLMSVYLQINKLTKE
jgi:hypothetical protein